MYRSISPSSRSSGIPERSARRLALIRGLPLLPVESAIAEIVQGYIRMEIQKQYQDRLIETTQSTELRGDQPAA